MSNLTDATQSVKLLFIFFYFILFFFAVLHTILVINMEFYAFGLWSLTFPGVSTSVSLTKQLCEAEDQYVYWEMVMMTYQSSFVFFMIRHQQQIYYECGF